MTVAARQEGNALVRDRGAAAAEVALAGYNSAFVAGAVGRDLQHPYDVLRAVLEAVHRQRQRQR